MPPPGCVCCDLGGGLVPRVQAETRLRSAGGREPPQPLPTGSHSLVQPPSLGRDQAPPGATRRARASESPPQPGPYPWVSIVNWSNKPTLVWALIPYQLLVACERCDGCECLTPATGPPALSFAANRLGRDAFPNQMHFVSANFAVKIE